MSTVVAVVAPCPVQGEPYIGCACQHSVQENLLLGPPHDCAGCSDRHYLLLHVDGDARPGLAPQQPQPPTDQDVERLRRVTLPAEDEGAQRWPQRRLVSLPLLLPK